MRRAIALAVLLLAPTIARAQQGGAMHVILVTGLSAEPQFAKQFAAAAGSIYDAARKQWHVGDSDIVYLSENPAADPARMTGKANKETIAAAFAAQAKRVHAGDVVLIVLMGHGSGEMAQSAVNVPGPDPTAADYREWLLLMRQGAVVFVNAATGSGDFAKVLAEPGRVVITATKTGMERNESVFAGFFATGLTGTESDADKDGRVSIAEAFAFAKAQVARSYETTGRLMTEHAIIADTSGVAARIAVGGDATSADPRVAALIGERRVLEASVDSLRRIKATVDSTAYNTELERLLLLIAAKTQAIRALQAGRKP